MAGGEEGGNGMGGASALTFADGQLAKGAALGEIGASGLKRSGGVVLEEFHRDLRGPKAAAVYREMLSNDPVIAGIRLLVETFVKGVTWRVVPGSESDAEDLKWAAFVGECMGDMSHPWSDLIADAISEAWYGFAPCEAVYKIRGGDTLDPTHKSRYSDGLIGWRKFPLRAQDSVTGWLFDDAGGVQGLVQQAAPDYRERTIPIEKMLLFRTSARGGNPEGVSLLRGAYVPFYYRKRIAEYEAIGVERDLAGIPVMWLPPALLASGATPEQKSARSTFEAIAKDLRADEIASVTMPLAWDAAGHKVYDLSLLASGGARAFPTDAILNRYAKLEATALLADLVLIGQESVGSFALASSKTNTLAVALNSLLDGIGDVLNRFAVDPLLRLNGVRPDRPPRLAHGDLETSPMAELADAIGKLAAAGMPLFPDPDVENVVRASLGLPAKKLEAA